MHQGGPPGSGGIGSGPAPRMDEAVRREIDKSAEYKVRMKEHENSVLFGTYINKVLIPDIKVGEEDLKSYYEKHKKAAGNIKVI